MGFEAEELNIGPGRSQPRCLVVMWGNNFLVVVDPKDESHTPRTWTQNDFLREARIGVDGAVALAAAGGSSCGEERAARRLLP